MSTSSVRTVYSGGSVRSGADTEMPDSASTSCTVLPAGTSITPVAPSAVIRTWICSRTASGAVQPARIASSSVMRRTRRWYNRILLLERALDVELSFGDRDRFHGEPGRRRTQLAGQRLVIPGARNIPGIAD